MDRYSGQFSDSGKRIVVAGIPRCGTTLLWRAIVGLGPGQYTPKGYTGGIIKTHSQAPKTLPEGYKVLFLFGDIINAVISTKLKRYDQRHFTNCGCSKDVSKTDIFEEDALNYEKIFDSWMRDNGYPVLAVRYEVLFDNLDKIENFSGCEH